MFITLELYMIGRLLSLIAPPFLEFRHRIGAVTDTRVLRALSLLLFDILNLVPGVKVIGIIGEFVPFSIGALIVLGVYFRDELLPVEMLTMNPSSDVPKTPKETDPWRTDAGTHEPS
jgi:hypothetical protein